VRGVRAQDPRAELAPVLKKKIPPREKKKMPPREFLRQASVLPCITRERAGLTPFAGSSGPFLYQRSIRWHASCALGQFPLAERSNRPPCWWIGNPIQFLFPASKSAPDLLRPSRTRSAGSGTRRQRIHVSRM